MGRRTDSGYVCDEEDRRKFQEDGYVHLPGELKPGNSERLCVLRLSPELWVHSK
jgi:hypothetical protein